MKEDGRDPPCGVIRLLIADDHALVRQGLSMLLDLEPDLAVIGQARNGCQALDMALELRPDVVLAATTMQAPDGIELAGQLRTALPQTGTVVVSMEEDPVRMKAAFAAGALGYVVKRGTESELVAAIHAAAAGECYVDPFLDETA